MAHSQSADDMNLEQLADYLAGHIAGLHQINAARKFPTGQSNPTYLLDSNIGPLVLRRKPAGVLLKSAHAVDREFRVQAALQESAVPVPQMLHLCVDADVLGADFYIMSHVTGRSFADPTMEGETPAGRAAIIDEMSRVLAAIHSVDLTTAGLMDYGPPGNYFERQLTRWSKQYRATELEPVADMDQLMTELHRALPADDGQRCLVHGDYRIDNMIFDQHSATCRAVLDWELSTIGHPFADLAAVIMQWRLPPGQEGRGLAGLDRSALGLMSDAEFIASYCDRRGLQGIDNFGFYLAFSFFRMAAILQGVRKRAIDGNASDPKAAVKLGAYVPMFARLGMDALA
ncbi:phosphotransferase family protein [Phaeobacter sp.]|uniref:phosphotransferase family protein n=1 Tax=Phaeobacter sp. TaxID=1902409 RepID=UPI0025DBCB56|nr:phosphotransferase family protein [Phaeobacter sp.]